MNADLTFAEAVRPGPTDPFGNSRITGYYPSAGCDTAPFSFLLPAFLRHRRSSFPTPDLFVYVDREFPHDPATDRLEYRDRSRDDVLVVETTSVRPLTVEGHPASLLRVRVHSDVPDEQRGYTVLRIRAENADVLEMCRRAGWSPDVYLSPDDGCCLGGGNAPRCENSVDPASAPILRFPRPPRVWVSDHINHPRPPAHMRFVPGDRIPTPEAFPLHLEKIALLSSAWGHGWTPFNGATAMRVTPREVS